MEPDGTVRSRASSTSTDTAGNLASVARQALAQVPGASASAAGVSFPDPDSRSRAETLSPLTDALGGTTPVKTLSTGNASAIAEVWYGAAKGAARPGGVFDGSVRICRSDFQRCPPPGRAWPGQFRAVARAQSGRTRRLPAPRMSRSGRRRGRRRPPAGVAHQIGRSFQRGGYGGR